MSPTKTASAESIGQERLRSALSRPIVVLLSLQMLGGLILSPTRTFLPIYLAELGHPALLVGAIVTAQQVMGLLAAWLGGALSDSLGRKRTLMLGQLGGLAAAASFLVGSPWLILPLRALSGFCGGLHTVAAQSYLVDMALAQHLGMISAFFNWGYTLGGAASSPVAGLALERWGYPAMAWGLSVCAMVAVALTAWLLPASQVRRGTASQGPWLGYAAVIRRPAMLTLAMLRFLPTFFWGMATVLIPLLLHGAGASKLMVAAYATISQVVAALAQGATGRAADRLPLRWPTLAVSATLATSILGLALAPGWLASVFLFGTLSTAAAWSLSTLMPSLVASVTPAPERGRALGWVHLWWNLGMVTGAMAGGALAMWGASVPFWLAGALNLVTVALVLRFFRGSHQAPCGAPDPV